MNRKIFSLVFLGLCLFVLSSAAFGQQQQQRRPKRSSGGLDNLSLPSTGAAIASSSWQTIAPEGAGFSVSMPGDPDEMSRDLTAGQGGISLREYRVKTEGAVYTVGVLLNFPKEIVQQPGFAAKYFEIFPEGMIKSSEYAHKRYSLRSQRSISFKDYAGREFKFDSPAYACTMRVYLIGQSVYVLLIETPKAPASADDGERFFSSFALTEN